MGGRELVPLGVQPLQHATDDSLKAGLHGLLAIDLPIRVFALSSWRSDHPGFLIDIPRRRTRVAGSSQATRPHYPKRSPFASCVFQPARGRIRARSGRCNRHSQLPVRKRRRAPTARLTRRHHRWTLFLGLPQRANSKNDRTSISPWALLAARSNRIGGQAVSRLAGGIVLAESSFRWKGWSRRRRLWRAASSRSGALVHGCADKIFSRSSTDRDAKYQSMRRSLDSEMPGGAGSELNQGLTPRSQSDVQRDVSRKPFRRCALVEHAFHNPVSDNKKRWNQKEIRHGERKDIG